MLGYDARRFWDGVFSRPEAPEETGPEERAMVSFLQSLTGDGPVLELAVGGGRIAIPLAATGIEVDGIDISQKGIEQIRAHPLGGAVNASVADISDFSLERRYSLIYCVANGLANVPDQDRQVSCFKAVAAHLAPGGVFLVHSGYTPRFFDRLRIGQYTEARHLELNFAWLQALRIDPAEQLVYQQDMYLTPEGIKFSPNVHRYVTAGELDLMARMAGLELRERWGNWSCEPFSSDSAMLLSTYTAQ